MTEVGLSLSDAVERNIRPGDSVHVMLGHSRWTAAAREMARQFWGTDAGITLIMSSLGALGALFFRGGMVRKVVTAYSGNSFPSYAPNPIFKQAYESGEVAVEHWSILTLGQRLEAAARGLPAMVTGSVVGSDLAGNEAFSVVGLRVRPGRVSWPRSPPTSPCCHAAVSDTHGNLAMSEPMLEGAWGAWAARRGVVATVERIVDDLGRARATGCGSRPTACWPWSRRPSAPTPAGATPRPPGGRLRRGHPLLGRGRRRRPRRLRRLGPRQPARSAGSRRPTSKLLGDDRLIGLRLLSDPDSWRHDAEANPVPTDEPDQRLGGGGQPRGPRGPVGGGRPRGPTPCWPAPAWPTWPPGWPWPGPGRRGARCASPPSWVCGTTRPTPADPYIFNHRVFPGTTVLADASTVLGMVVGGPGTTTIGCLGAAEVDRDGNINSTRLADGRFLVGSGGANDVVSRAAACVVVTLGRPQRLPADGRATSPPPASG